MREKWLKTLINPSLNCHFYFFFKKLNLKCLQQLNRDGFNNNFEEHIILAVAMWYFLKRFMKLLGGKVLSKMAPRLIFFQYYNRVSLELEQKKKKYQMRHLTPAAILLFRGITKNPQKKLGISCILQQNTTNAEVSALDLNDYQSLWENKTVYSSYEQDNNIDQEWEFIEMQSSIINED